jgi:transposase-like protein
MGTILPESLEREIAALTTDEKRALATMLRRMVAEETSPGGTPGECPLCHHDRVVKKGHGKDGTQRWKCKGCGRTFGESTMRVLLQSKLGRDTWLAYAEGMADGASLRELARRCGVCLKTSWFMRMRLCEAMGAHLDAFLSGPGVAVEADGKMPHESSGGDDGRGGSEIPGGRHESGKSLHARGCPGQQVCVPCVADDRGDVFATVMGRAHGGAELIERSLEGGDRAGHAPDDL